MKALENDQKQAETENIYTLKGGKQLVRPTFIQGTSHCPRAWRTHSCSSDSVAGLGGHNKHPELPERLKIEQENHIKKAATDRGIPNICMQTLSNS